MVEIKLDIKPVTYKCPFTKKWVILVPHRIVTFDNGGTLMIVWRCNYANCVVSECRYSVPNVKGGEGGER